mgnify:CR=1 FL=1|tara:strand:- start:1205 stop:1696 length:492 start_codon:yes stop_codon:yes gene_type:complete
MNYILLCIIGALLLSISDLCSKYALNNGVSNVNFLFWSHGITYFVCLIILVTVTYYFSLHFLSNNKKNNNIYELIKLNKNNKLNYACIISGIFAFLALIVIIYSFSLSKNIGYNVAIISSTCLFTLLLSILFFKAKIELNGIIGVILILLGIFFISKTSNKMK